MLRAKQPRSFHCSISKCNKKGTALSAAPPFLNREHGTRGNSSCSTIRATNLHLPTDFVLLSTMDGGILIICFIHVSRNHTHIPCMVLVYLPTFTIKKNIHGSYGICNPKCSLRLVYFTHIQPVKLSSLVGT